MYESPSGSSGSSLSSSLAGGSSVSPRTSTSTSTSTSSPRMSSSGQRWAGGSSSEEGAPLLAQANVGGANAGGASAGGIRVDMGGIRDKDLRRALEDIDVDHNGVLSEAELLRLFESYASLQRSNRKLKWVVLVGVIALLAVLGALLATSILAAELAKDTEPASTGSGAQVLTVKNEGPGPKTTVRTGAVSDTVTAPASVAVRSMRSSLFGSRSSSSDSSSSEAAVPVTRAALAELIGTCQAFTGGLLSGTTSVFVVSRTLPYGSLRDSLAQWPYVPQVFVRIESVSGVLHVPMNPRGEFALSTLSSGDVARAWDGLISGSSPRRICCAGEFCAYAQPVATSAVRVVPKHRPHIEDGLSAHLAGARSAIGHDLDECLATCSDPHAGCTRDPVHGGSHLCLPCFGVSVIECSPMDDYQSPMADYMGSHTCPDGEFELVGCDAFTADIASAAGLAADMDAAPVVVPTHTFVAGSSGLFPSLRLVVVLAALAALLSTLL